jgi:hypothetical protein
MLINDEVHENCVLSRRGPVTSNPSALESLKVGKQAAGADPESVPSCVPEIIRA